MIYSHYDSGYQLLPYTDKELVKFVWDMRAKKDLHVSMVSTEWMEVTKIALQSLRPRAFVMDQLFNIAGVLSSTPSYEHLKYIHMMDFENVCVTQQKTIYDCGVFVLKFFSAVDNEILWKDTEYFENLPQYRKSTMLELLNWEKNNMKVFF
ncbi:hypothetical protein KSS87_008335 [Heliosperma pusillum]|nr:hypothetical protein KSS87_008335 [Heliosperma pusillum]